jgi:prophage regulatory protein
MEDASTRPARFLRKIEVLSRTGLSGSTVWRLERAGKFPTHRQVSPHRIAWLESDIEDWIAPRVEAPERRA